jgi:hypothetical protein
MTIDSVYQITKKEEPKITAIQPPKIVKGTVLPSKNIEEEQPLVPVWMIMIVIVSGLLHLFARKRIKKETKPETIHRTTIVSRRRK